MRGGLLGYRANRPRICHRFCGFRMASRDQRPGEPCIRVGSGSRPVTFSLGYGGGRRCILRSIGGRLCSERSRMSPDTLNSLLSLCLGFAVAGALASGYQALLQRPAGFGLLQEGAAPKTFAAGSVPGFFGPLFLIPQPPRRRRGATPPLRVCAVGGRPAAL